MTTYIVTYDIKETSPDPHATFLEQARKNNWNYWILSSANVWYRLPNTTLVGNFQTMDAAEKAFEATRVATAKVVGKAVTIEKFIIAEYGAARFNSDVTQAAKLA